MKSISAKLRLGVILGACAMAIPMTALGTQASTGSSSSGRMVSPSIAVGPRATAVSSSGTNYGLFTCQVGLSSATCYDPYQMRKAYQVDSLIKQGYDGTGRTIVIVDAFGSPYLSSDLSYFDSFYGLPPASLTTVAPDGTVPFNANDPVMMSWTGEIALDVEWAHAMAPGAKIVLDIAKTSDDPNILSALKYAVDNKLGDVISMSFGEGETCVDPSVLSAEHQVFADATRKNITLFASSGDQGASQPTCDGKSWTQVASSPASDPLVTAVGGTELHAAGYCLTVLGCDPATNPAFGTYQGEIAWNELGQTESTGGGFSKLFSEPPYQKGVLPGGTQRSVPDIAYNAAIYHGVLVRYLGATYLFGGTSAGSPQMSALIAIADQKAGHDLGFINTALYHMGQNAFYSRSMHDVTSGSNSVIEFDAAGNPVSVQGWNAGTGWDATTGLGSPIGDQLVNNLGHFVSPGDATAVLANSTPHGGNAHSNTGKVTPH